MTNEDSSCNPIVSITKQIINLIRLDQMLLLLLLLSLSVIVLCEVTEPLHLYVSQICYSNTQGHVERSRQSSS